MKRPCLVLGLALFPHGWGFYLNNLSLMTFPLCFSPAKLLNCFSQMSPVHSQPQNHLGRDGSNKASFPGIIPELVHQMLWAGAWSLCYEQGPKHTHTAVCLPRAPAGSDAGPEEACRVPGATPRGRQVRAVGAVRSPRLWSLLARSHVALRAAWASLMIQLIPEHKFSTAKNTLKHLIH